MEDTDPRSAVTLTDMMRRRAALTPDRQYFELYGETVTYGRLWELSGRHAAALARAGIAAGDKVCLIYPTCTEFFATFFGALRIGAVPVPLYPTLGVEGTAAIMRNADAVAVTTIGWFRPGVEASVALAPNVRTILEPPDLDVDAPVPATVSAREDDLAFLQYTSGSTGNPRGVMLTHANVVSTIRFMAEGAGLTAEDRVVSWLPLYHDMGLIGCAFTPPLIGTPLWLLPPDLRNPRQWLELITAVRATFTVSPDFGYRNCVRNVRDTTGLDLTSLRGALSGAEPVRVSTIESFERHFGLKNIILPCYGLAEATLAVAIWPRATPLRLDASGRFLSVGKPCTGVALRIMPMDEGVAEPRASETGHPRPDPSTRFDTEGRTPRSDPPRFDATSPGEICVKSPGVMRGYYNNPEATARVLPADGWLRTGDLGFLDADGYLYITGRLKDVMILAGQNVVPSDIEEIVDHIPGVRYAAAVGLESDRTGSQRLHVVAEVRDESAPEDGLQELVRQIVNAVHEGTGHRPARVLLVRSGTIPKTSSGKIQRARLGEMIGGGDLRDKLVK